MPISRRIPISRRRLSMAMAIGGVVTAGLGLATAAEAPSPPSTDPLLGTRVKLKAQWIGKGKMKRTMSILVMAGHADSQNMHGSGTSGAAVDVHGAAPMDARMRDELFWNFKVRDAVVRQGRRRGLVIASYTPPASRSVTAITPAPIGRSANATCATGATPSKFISMPTGKMAMGLV